MHRAAKRELGADRQRRMYPEEEASAVEEAGLAARVVTRPVDLSNGGADQLGSEHRRWPTAVPAAVLGRALRRRGRQLARPFMGRHPHVGSAARGRYVRRGAAPTGVGGRGSPSPAAV